MVTGFFEAPTGKIANAELLLEVKARLPTTAMEAALSALDDARLEMLLTFTAQTSSAQFHALGSFVRRTREFIFTLVQRLNDTNLGIAALSKAQNLLGIVETHVILRDHVDAAANQPGSIGGDVLMLRTSFAEIDREFGNFRTSVDKFFDAVRNGA